MDQIFHIFYMDVQIQKFHLKILFIYFYPFLFQFFYFTIPMYGINYGIKIEILFQKINEEIWTKFFIFFIWMSKYKNFNLKFHSFIFIHFYFYYCNFLFLCMA